LCIAPEAHHPRIAPEAHHPRIAPEAHHPRIAPEAHHPRIAPEAHHLLSPALEFHPSGPPVGGSATPPIGET
jgi:hypothetical protein